MQRKYKQFKVVLPQFHCIHLRCSYQVQIIFFRCRKYRSILHKIYILNCLETSNWFVLLEQSKIYLTNQNWTTDFLLDLHIFEVLLVSVQAMIPSTLNTKILHICFLHPVCKPCFYILATFQMKIKYARLEVVIKSIK